MKKLIAIGGVFNVVNFFMFVVFFSAFKSFDVGNIQTVILLSGIITACFSFIYSFINKKNAVFFIVSLVSALAVLYATVSIICYDWDYLYFISLFLIIMYLENIPIKDEEKKNVKERLLESLKIYGILFIQSLVVYFAVYQTGLYFIKLY